ncbi:MAG: 3-methyl-2-oxobutanoate hydroxymethyltransferase [Prochlorotrichaceae cyanobacterium]
MATSVTRLQEYKKQGHPITALTAWDALFASILDESGVDFILVGDSLSMVALGHTSTIPLSLDELIHHAKAVRRGVTRSLLVCDLPFMSYQASPEQALQAAGRCLKEALVDAVKLEGGYPRMADTVAQLVESGIPVLGHVGLTPQSIKVLGLRQQGKSPETREKIIQEALALEEAGAFAIVLEHIPPDLAQAITQQLQIPTIGIGAGPHCDGQVLVTADLLGLSARMPPFAKAYADFRTEAIAAVQRFCQEVKDQRFPNP